MATYILARMSFFSGHHSAAKQDTVERHWGISVFLSPFTGKVGVSILTPTETRSSDQDNIWASSDSTIHGKDWLMEVFVTVMSTTTTTGPLDHDWEVWVGLSNVDTLLN